MNIASKAAGVILVVFATSGYGWLMSRDLRLRMMELLELKKIMFILKGEISFGHTPIMEAFENIAPRCREPLSSMLMDFSKKKDCIRECSIGVLWQETMEKGLIKTHLSRGEKERLTALGEMYGLNNCETQLKLIDTYLDELVSEITQLEAILPKKVRLYNSLGIMCGVVISLIII